MVENRGQGSGENSKFRIQNSKFSVRGFVRTIGISILTTAVLTGIRYLGLLQPLELKAYDRLLQLRPAEWTDSRLLVVTVDDEDIQAQKKRRGSLSDATLKQLLEKLDRFQPRSIGLDIYRDFPVEADSVLASRLKQDPKLIVVCKVSDPEAKGGIAPPPEVVASMDSGDRIGFSDFIKKPDGVLRRQLLYMDLPADSPCAARYAFSVLLASRYLAAENIQPRLTANGDLRFGKVVLKSLQSHTGGYQGISAWGNQILLNYRANPRAIDQVRLRQVLSGQITPDAVKNRIILIGVTAKSSGDYWLTPYLNSSTEEMPGVIVQAEMVSQILSAVKDQRSLLWTWPQMVEIGWIWIWSLIGGIAAWWLCLRSISFRQFLLQIVLIIVIASGVLGVVCYVALIQGGWLPLVPSTISLVVTAIVVTIYQNVWALRSHHLVLHQE